VDLSFTDEERAFAADVRTWLTANVEHPPPFASIDEEVAWGRQWQAKLAAGRWVGIHWPAEYGGRGASPVQVAIFNMEYARARASQPVNRVGINLAGPTLLAHGTDEQRQRWLPRILTAEEIWCQLFSEPGAGSDLASLTTPGGGSAWLVRIPTPPGITASRTSWSIWTRRASTSGPWSRSPERRSSTRCS
jgi:alkylation response protein AidB-like acyl-CoA dehydrogenase